MISEIICDRGIIRKNKKARSDNTDWAKDISPTYLLNKMYAGCKMALSQPITTTNIDTVGSGFTEYWLPRNIMSAKTGMPTRLLSTDISWLYKTSPQKIFASIKLPINKPVISFWNVRNALELDVISFPFLTEIDFPFIRTILEELCQYYRRFLAMPMSGL